MLYCFEFVNTELHDSSNFFRNSKIPKSSVKVPSGIFSKFGSPRVVLYMSYINSVEGRLNKEPEG